MQDYFEIIEFDGKRFPINNNESLMVMPVALIITKLRLISEEMHTNHFIFNASSKIIKFQEALLHNIKYAKLEVSNPDLICRVKSLAQINNVILVDNITHDEY